MRRHLLLAPLLALPAFACGSPIVDPLDVNLSGSYELTAGTVVQKAPSYGGPDPVNTPAPSNGKRFRLDLRRSGSSYDAVVTPEFGNPAAMAVTVSGGTLVLTGEANVAGGSSYVGNVYDRWTSIVVPVGSDGLGANVSLTGDEMVNQGDVGWVYDVSVGASVVRDTDAPSFKILGGGTAAGKYLPWDKLTVSASEPVNASKFEALVHANVKTANAVFASRNSGSDTSADWAGRVLLEGGFDDFDAPGGAGLLTIDPGIPDLAGNSNPPSMDPQSAAFEVIDIGAPQIAIDFDGKDTFSPAMWGNAQVVKGSECEANVGCARLGVFQQMYCESSSDGIAARLTGAGAKKLAFRMRVHVEPKYGYGGSSNMFENGPVLNVELARSGGPLARVNVTTPKLTNVGTDEKPSFESQWVDASVALPAGGSTLGFAIRPTSMFPYGCGGGPAVVPMDVTVWVDSLRME